MTSKVTQKELSNLARTFIKAALKKQDDAAFNNRMNSVSGLKELKAFMAPTATAVSIKNKFGEKAYDDKDFITATIEAADLLAKDYLKFCTTEEIKELTPAGASDKGIIASLEKRGAKNLANFFKH